MKEIRFVIKEGTGTGTGTTADGIIVWWTKTYPTRISLWDHSQSRWFFANFGSPTILEDTNGLKCFEEQHYGKRGYSDPELEHNSEDGVCSGPAHGQQENLALGERHGRKHAE